MSENNVKVVRRHTASARRKRRKNRNRLLIAAIFLLLIFLFVIKPCYMKNTVADGVKVCGEDLGGMTKKEAKSAISKKAKKINTAKPLTFVYKQEEATIEAFELSPEADITGSLETAFRIGKTGSVFSRLADIASAKFGGRDLEMEITLDYKSLEKILNPVVSAVPGSAQPAEYEISDDGITVTPGNEGMMADFDSLYNDISARIFNRKKGRIEISVKKSSYDDITAEEIYKKFHSEVKNAEFIKTESGDITISPSSEGIDFDIDAAQNILDKADGEICTIPIEYIKPDITTDELKDKLFTDELSSYNSTYGMGNSDRNINVELSCSKMNGTQLLPGEIFSYVGAVGQGTYEEGYVDANIYADGQVMTGVAGGICQGSSTLYSAVLFADLDIVQRVNHSMPVGYVPRGMDATIAVPYIDFQFRNSTNYPIKIIATTVGGLMEIRILGYNEHPSKEVEITNKLISTTPFKTKEVLNTDLAPGTEYIKQNGTDGYVVETYKTIKFNGEEQSTVLVATSKYDPINKIVEVPKLSEDEDEESGESDESEKSEEKTEESPDTE